LREGGEIPGRTRAMANAQKEQGRKIKILDGWRTSSGKYHRGLQNLGVVRGRKSAQKNGQSLPRWLFRKKKKIAEKRKADPFVGQHKTVARVVRIGKKKEWRDGT